MGERVLLSSSGEMLVCEMGGVAGGVAGGVVGGV